MNPGTEIVGPTGNELIEFGSFRHPETMFKEAELVAVTFTRRAEKLQLYKKIGESKHLLIEGWQMLAAMYRVTAGIVDDRYIEIGDARGFEATAEAIFVPTAQRISTAKAMCLSDEEKWGMRNKYDWRNGERVLVGSTPTPLQQLRSMAQTRACSKVLSNLLKWVARIGGFAGTPAEEAGGEPEPSGNIRQPQQRAAASNGGTGKISERQASRIWGLGRGANKSKEDIAAIVKQFGFDSATDVTVDRYDELCAELQRVDA